MSGGVDSSVAAARLVEQGHEVIGITLRLWEPTTPSESQKCCAPDDVRVAQQVAEHLKFPHHTIDKRSLFANTVVNPFIDAYLNATTPCPCATCNQLIKIPTMLELAREFNATSVATGHYAKISTASNHTRVAKGSAPTKDQSYFLSTIPPKFLPMLTFPIGNDTKANIRKEAHQRGLPTANKTESQDLCFVPLGTYTQFIEERARDRIKPGWIHHTNGNKLGPHTGIHQFTRGQRKGLGISTGKPTFVTDIIADQSIVVVGDTPPKNSTIIIDNPTIAQGITLPIGHPITVTILVRYRDPGTKATIVQDTDGRVLAHLDQPVAASPGQLAVAYVGDEVVLGGTISQVLDEP